MIAEVNPEIRKATDALYTLSADPSVRAEYEMREKAWRDRISQFHDAVTDAVAVERGKWQDVVADKNAALANKDAALANKDAALANKDAEIERLRAQLQAKTGG